MITLSKGNVLKADAEVLVNTVNCVGYMGKGIALQFKKAFPDNFEAYQKACKRNELTPGKMFVFKTESIHENPKYIINFPTKRHWRGKSRLEDIELGLEALVSEVRRLGARSVAVPPLGCGLGGLRWQDVRPLIEKAFKQLPRVHLYLYEPHGAPKPETMPVGSKKPRMTLARALFIKLMEQYKKLDYKLTLLEIQKLAYFLQESGQALRLNYSKFHYGPFSQNLNKVLEVLDGHFISGYGDNPKPDTVITILPGAIQEADKELRKSKNAEKKLNRVTGLIEGFETPYGVELLASVHWLAVHEREKANSPSKILEQLRLWNKRKRFLFKPYHVEVAWKRLVEQDFIAA